MRPPASPAAPEETRRGNMAGSSGAAGPGAADAGAAGSMVVDGASAGSTATLCKLRVAPLATAA